MRWDAWGLTSQGKTGDFKAIIWIFFFLKENRQLCNLMQTVSGIFALKDAAGRNRSQNPSRPLLPDFYYYRALTANTASKLAILVTMAIKWVRFPSIIAWIVSFAKSTCICTRGGGRRTLGKIVLSTLCRELDTVVYQSAFTWRIITMPVSEDAGTKPVG